MIFKPNLWTLESTSKANFNPKKVLWKTVSFYGQTKAMWAYCSQDPAFMEPVNLSLISSTLRMIFKPNLSTLESTSKANFHSKQVLWKTISFYGQTKAMWAYCSQDPAFMEPVNLSSTFGMTFNTYPQPLRVFFAIIK